MDGYETVLFVARECYVYRLPPRTAASGFKAAEWGDMEAFLWKGRLRIIEQSGECSIRLEDGSSGELFALCPYSLDGTAVEPVLDSSRYFVLRVESDAPGQEGKKRKAYIGMGFQDRAESFDFNVALQDWTKRTKAAQRGATDPEGGDDLVDADSGPSPHIPTGPKRDFSLKEGQTFSIKLPGGGGGSTRKAPPASGGLGGFGGGPLLPPPPSAKRG